MIFVYILRSELHPEHTYTGISNDPSRRLTEHNGGHSTHTNKFRPWKLILTIGFDDSAKAAAFEKYLKSGSGRAFAKKHF